MENLEKNALMKEMNVDESMNVNGGWNLDYAIMGAAAVCPLGPGASLIAFAVCGFF